jgi:hypothetical protein
MQSHTHVATSVVTDPGHAHGLPDGNSGGFGPSDLAALNTITSHNSGTATTGISVTTVNATTGSGASQNMPPTIVSFLALIKT